MQYIPQFALLSSRKFSSKPYSRKTKQFYTKAILRVASAQLGLTEKVSVSNNPTDCILNGDRELFSRLHKKFVAYMCANDSYPSQSHASAKRECMWASAHERCIAHTRVETCERKTAWEYLRVLANEHSRVLASTRNYSRMCLTQLHVDVSRISASKAPKK